MPAPRTPSVHVYPEPSLTPCRRTARPRQPHALVGAAVAKLVLFDLAALDGIARVAAFCGGIALLAAGVRYGRAE
jgi:hypothetical protein